MIKLIMHGCNGVMGQVISQIVEETDGAKMVAGIDRFDDGKNSYPVFTDIKACDVEADAIIDFSAAPAVDALLDYAVEKQIPVVVCTTGLSEEQLEKLEEASKKVAVLRSANMSLGVNMLLKLLKEATEILAPAGFDVDIVEKHHRRKLDAPSGTALALADAVNEAVDNEHEVIFAGQDEVIEFKHTAYSRAIFGKGAVSAAMYLAGQPAGLYDMSHVIG